MQGWHRVRAPWRQWDETRLRRNLGVYVHVPFCLRKCRYCDFLSYGGARPHGLEPDAYAATLADEARRRGAWAQAHYGPQGRAVDSIFFGGGTPTYLAPQTLAEVITAVRTAFPQAVDCVEVTVEANPDTLTPGYLDTIARAGVNRLSIGIQATQARHLRFLGRTHRWVDIAPRLRAAAHGPIRRLSFDVIYAVPGLTLAELRATLERLLALRPEHISAYELIIEPETPLAAWAASFPQQLVPQEQSVEQQRLIERTLAGAGLYRYEVSNYARPGCESRHNLRYWRGGDYVGLGLGAASRSGVAVVNNPREWDAYLRHCAAAGSADDPLVQAAGAAGADYCAPPADAFLRLRTRLGLPLAEAKLDQRWLAAGWVRLHAGRMELTSRGLDFADAMARAC